MRSPNSTANLTPNPPPPAKSRHLLVSALLLVTVAALGFFGWSWKQSSRPGEVHLRAGMEAAQTKQNTLAEQEWKQGTLEDPGFPDNYAQLGDFYLHHQRFPEAIAQYQSALKLTPSDGLLYIRLYWAQLGAHQMPEALVSARRASELLPDNADAAGLYGMLAARQGDRPAALHALRRAHELKPDDQDYLHELARQEMNSLDMAGAEQDVRSLLKMNPADGEANRLLGLLYKQKPPTPENVKTALDLARRAVAAQPDSPDTHLLLGQLTLNARHPAQALLEFQKAQALNPDSQEILSGLVTCYTQLQQPAKAAQAAATLQLVTMRRNQIEHLRNTVQINPADTASRLQLAKLDEDSGNLAAAADDYLQAARHAPGNAHVQAAAAQFYARHRAQAEH
jgi:cytochrome c-type biogenesis protein CcmH/NrfG